MKIHIAVVSLWAEDVPAAAHFYRDVLGLPLMAHGPKDRPHFNMAGTYLTIVRGRPARFLELEPRFPVIAFSIPDLDAAVNTLRYHGVDLPWGEEKNTTGRWVMFHDPAGNLIELVEALHQGEE